jgi:hypothetical protein
VQNSRISFTQSAVPEADTYAMVLAGLGLIGEIIRRRLCSWFYIDSLALPAEIRCIACGGCP